MDISGLGAPEGQVLPHAVATWEVRHRFDAARAEAEACRSRAQPSDVWRPARRPRRVRDAILRGFRSAYAPLATRRDELLSPDGLVHRYADAPVSVFLRSSRTYRRLLRESYHPDVLRDALDRDWLFDLLWMEVDRDQDLARVLRFELDDLSQATFHASRLDLGRAPCGTSGTSYWPSSSRRPSLAAVGRIVDRLGDQDCARQAWFIEASLATLPGWNGARRRIPVRRPAAPP